LFFTGCAIAAGLFIGIENTFRLVREEEDKMGFFADIKAMKDVQLIMAGGTAKLSISQITSHITNLPDARKRLSKEEYESVYALFKELRKCDTKIEMDFFGYVETVKEIILKYDAIAPYEKYSGGNELEFSLMMDDLRKESSQPDLFEMLNFKEIVFNDEARKYMKSIIENSSASMIIPVSQEEAENIMKVIYHYHDYGKEVALREFDSVARKIIEREGIGVVALMKIGYLSGILNTNGVLTIEESDEFSEKYIPDVACK